MPERMKTSFLLSIMTVTVWLIMSAFFPVEPSGIIQPQEIEARYVFNKSTKKFHYADCTCVQWMSEANKGYHDGTREELLLQGFDPCRSCYP